MSPTINAAQDIIRFIVSYLLQQVARALLIAAHALMAQQEALHGQ